MSNKDLFTINGHVNKQIINDYMSQMHELSLRINELKIKKSNQYGLSLIDLANEDRHFINSMLSSIDASIFVEYHNEIKNPSQMLISMFSIFSNFRYELSLASMIPTTFVFNDLYQIYKEDLDQLTGSSNLIRLYIHDHINNIDKNDINNFYYMGYITSRPKFINSLKNKETFIFEGLCQLGSEKIKVSVAGKKSSQYNILNTINQFIENGYFDNVNVENIMKKFINKYKGVSFLDSLLDVFNEYINEEDNTKKQIASVIANNLKTMMISKSLKDKHIQVISNFILKSTFDLSVKEEILLNYINTWGYKMNYYDISSLIDLSKWVNQNINNTDTLIKYSNFIEKLLDKQNFESELTQPSTFEKNIHYLLSSHNITKRALIKEHMKMLIKSNEDGLIMFLSKLTDKQLRHCLTSFKSESDFDYLNQYMDKYIYLSMVFILARNECNINIPMNKYIRYFIELYKAFDPDILNKYEKNLNQFNNVNKSFSETFKDENNVYNAIKETGKLLKLDIFNFKDFHLSLKDIYNDEKVNQFVIKELTFE